MPIRLRLTLIVVAAALAVIASGGVAGALLIRSSVLSATDEGLLNQTQPIVSTLAAHGTSDMATIHRQLDISLDAFAEVLAPDGTVIAVSPGINEMNLLPGWAWATVTSGEPVIVERNGPPPHDNEQVRLLGVPVEGPDGRYVVVVGTSVHPLERALHWVRIGLLGGGTAAVLACGLGTWLLAGAALRPVERLRGAVAAFPDDGTHRRVEAPRNRDEVSRLALTLNELLDRVSRARARERRFVADASHELRTPLTVLRTELELADRPGRSRAELAESVTYAAREATRIAALAENLLLLARTDGGHPIAAPEAQPVGPILTDALRAVRARAASRRITIESLVDPPDLTAPVDATRLRQAVDNLVDNALRATPEGGRITASAVRDHDTVQIAVADTGPGFAADLPPDEAFLPFRRSGTSRAREDGGAGLGLAIVRVIAQAHQGTARARNNPGGGATVYLTLPGCP